MLLLEYRLMKARADMKQGSDDAALATKILSDIKTGVYGEAKTRSSDAARNIVENAFISGAPA